MSIPSALCSVPGCLLVAGGHSTAPQESLLNECNKLEQCDPSPFELSKIAQNHKDVKDMFELYPELIGPVNAVLKKYKSTFFPCQDSNVIDHWRKVSRHFIRERRLVAAAAEEQHEQQHQKLQQNEAKMIKENRDASYAAIDDEEVIEDPLSPFFVVDLGRIVIQMAKFRKAFPQVQPFYAVKCNNNEALLDMLAALGCSFDCASQAEIRLIVNANRVTDEFRDSYAFNKNNRFSGNKRHNTIAAVEDTSSLVPSGTAENAAWTGGGEHNHRMNIDNNEHLNEEHNDNEETSTNNMSAYGVENCIVFANPCKVISCMKAAERNGVRMTTFDHLEELDKIAKYMPSAKAIIRIKTCDANASCAFSAKFGAAMEEVPELLRHAMDLGVQVVGVSFHVGSNNNDVSSYIGAVMDAKQVFAMAEELGFDMKILDLGGGWPGTDPNEQPRSNSANLLSKTPEEVFTFEILASKIKPLLDEHFSNVHIIAEPGRFFSASTHTLACNVHAERKIPNIQLAGENFDNFAHVLQNTDTEFQYYVNDGIYQSFNCIIFDHVHPELHMVDPTEEQLRKLHVTTMWGPTCDSLDCILRRQVYPELNVGDWLFVVEFGSYTTSGGCPFNGFETKTMIYINSVPGIEQ